MDEYEVMGRMAAYAWQEGKPMQLPDINDTIKNMKALGWTWEGRTFLFGEGEVSLERFNEVVGGDLGNGLTLSYEIVEDEEETPT